MDTRTIEQRIEALRTRYNARDAYGIAVTIYALNSESSDLGLANRIVCGVLDESVVPDALASALACALAKKTASESLRTDCEGK